MIFSLTAEYIKKHAIRFYVLAGRILIHAACYGGSGSIAATANIAPHCCRFYDKYVAGDIKGSLEASVSHCTD